MLNNALMTIEALAGLNSVHEITADVLRQQFENRRLWELYRRMKSYTMLFTRNGPLLNDAKLGEAIYKELMLHIIRQPESAGPHQCEISGLRFSTKFSTHYLQVLRNLGVPEKEIEKKDRTINRCWFPLIGALGSDAQALPQAKFEISIHPICLVVIQFLPLSALIYKGGILLFDTVNTSFARDFIAKSVDRVQKAIQMATGTEPVENIKDFDKGKYLLRSIEIFEEKALYYEDKYTDINLWSFTNSGTGASCEVDRVPSRVFRSLCQLYRDDCQADLKMLLNNSRHADAFVAALTNGDDYDGLYPHKDYPGVGVPFYEAYQQLIGKAHQLEYARYIAGIIKKTPLAKADEKMLLKTDAHKQKEYPAFLQKILVDAAGRGEWSLAHHLNILDDPDATPVKGYTYGILRKIHFYYQKNGWRVVSAIPAVNKLTNTLVGKICSFAIHLIEKDAETSLRDHRKKLRNPQEYLNFSLAGSLVRQAHLLTLAQVTSFFFPNYRLQHAAISFLLRLYFSQSEQTTVAPVELPEVHKTPWLCRLEDFARLYTDYYLNKYQGDWVKFYKHVIKPFPTRPGEFQHWLDQAFDNMRNYFETEAPLWNDFKGRIDDLEQSLCFDDEGNNNPFFASFAIGYCLQRHYHAQSANIFSTIKHQ